MLFVNINQIIDKVVFDLKFFAASVKLSWETIYILFKSWKCNVIRHEIVIKTFFYKPSNFLDNTGRFKVLKIFKVVKYWDVGYRW